MSEQRTMTIKRGMTRIKTIKSQLDNIIEKIQQYGVVSDKQKHMLGDTTLSNSPEDIKKNHAQARAQVESLYQQFHDLLDEYVKIKMAIDKANNETFITVAGKRMSLREALIYKQREDGVAKYYRSMISAYNQSVASAQRAVMQYNSQYNNVNNEDVRKTLLADIESLVKRERLEELDKFVVEFLTEVDGALDDAIVSTPIVID